MPSTIFVSDDIERLPFLDSKVVSAIDYIHGAADDLEPGSTVMCVGEEHAYGTLGYYVALLAEARGHRPLPSTHDILAWGRARTDVGEFCDWRRASAEAEAAARPRTHQGWARLKRPADRRNRCGRPVIGVLLTPGLPFAASSADSIGDFARAAGEHGLDVVLLDKTQIEEIDGIDALLIRDLTRPTNHAYRFARRAADMGIPVLDDPASIVRCTNKAFVHERLQRLGVPTPRSLIMTSDMSIEQAIAQLGLPLVLKIPDGSFCIGIKKVESASHGAALLAEARQHYPVLVAQEYLPTDFDWRIGILDGLPLYACKYYMARNHWQVIKYGGVEPAEKSDVVSIPLSDVPPALLDCAARAAAAMGNGLYGVDLKQHGGADYVIEVNDNPDLDTAFEVAAAEWSRLAEWFRIRIERARRMGDRPVARRLSA